MYQELLGWTVACLGLCLGIYGIIQARYFRKMAKAYEPLIKQGERALAWWGKQGKEKQMENSDFAEVEQSFKEAGFEMAMEKYPEVAVLMGWLQENKPEIFSKVEENPTILLQLYKKYAPYVKELIGMKGETQKKVMYDA